MWDFGQILIAQCVVFAMFFLLRIYARSRIPMCTSTADLSGKTAIVTGANCNIGYFTALDFAKRNARVILACRSKQKAEKAREEIVALSGNKNVVVRILDLSYMRSVRAFAKQINAEEPRLNILVNNAGIVSAGKPREVTDEGLETLYAANYFGPFLLTNLLLGLLKKSGPSRIVNVSSVVNKWGTIDFENLQGEKIFKIKNRYYDSKLALTLFTRELAKRLEGTGVTANAVHPGSVSTNVLNHVYTPARLTLQWGVRLFGKTAEEGAQPSIYLAVSDEVKDINGKYFVHCSIREEEANPMSRDMNLAEKLWNVSADLTGLTKAE